MPRNNQRGLMKTLETAFTCAGVKKGRHAAAFALYALEAGKNPHQASKYRSPWHLPPSVFSTWLGRMNWRAFQESINLWHRHELRRMLRLHPIGPGGSINVGDVHQSPYTPDKPHRHRKTKRRVSPELTRKSECMPATAKNKTSPFCNPWFVCTLVWESEGQVWSCPYFYGLLTHGQHAPATHAKAMIAYLKAVGVTPSSSVLDRWYQGRPVRDVFLAAGWKYRIRYTAHESKSNVVTVVANGRRTTTYDLLKETIGHADAKRRLYVDPMLGKPALDWTRSVRVRFVGDDVDTELVMVARTIRDAKGPPKWALEQRMSLVIVCNPGDNPRRVLADFRLRWTIEVWFRALVNAAPKHYAKTLPAHVVRFLGHATHIYLALVNQVEERVRQRRHGIRGPRETLVDAALRVLGGDPTRAPFQIG
jgi:hypothetical protein